MARPRSSASRPRPPESTGWNCSCRSIVAALGVALVAGLMGRRRTGAASSPLTDRCGRRGFPPRPESAAPPRRCRRDRRIGHRAPITIVEDADVPAATPFSSSGDRQQRLEALVALGHAALHAGGQQCVAGLDVRTDRTATQAAPAARRGPRTCVNSMLTMSGAPSNSNVWMISSLSRTAWNTPLNQYSSPSGPRCR